MTTVLASGAATTEHHKLRTGTSETGLGPWRPEARWFLLRQWEDVPGLCPGFCWLPVPWCRLSCCLRLHVSFSLCVCVFVQISLTLLQYDLISTSCVCYNPIPKQAHPLSYWRLGLQHRGLGAMIQPLTPYNNTNIKL